MLCRDDVRNLGNPVTLHTQMKNLPDHFGGGFVDDPVILVLRIFNVAEGRIRAERLSGVSLGFKHGSDFPTGVLGVEFVEQVDERRHVVLRAVYAVHTVIYGDETDIVVREHHLGQHSNLQIISAEPAHILYDERTDLTFINHPGKALPVRPVKGSAAVAVIHEKLYVAEAVVCGIFL